MPNEDLSLWFENGQWRAGVDAGLLDVNELGSFAYTEIGFDPFAGFLPDGVIGGLFGFDFTAIADDGLYWAYENPVAAEGDSPLDAITWGTVLAGASDPGTLIIPVYFQPFAEDFVTDFWGEYDARDWTQHELGQFRIAFDMMESILDVQFVEVFTPEEATFHLSAFRGSPFLTPAGAMFPPGYSETPGFGYFNRRASVWDESGEGGLFEGGAGYEVIIHELAHGLGLAHPHDDGGTSVIMNGVDENAQTDTGDFELNQAVFTIMSYVDGWAAGPNGESPSKSFGWAGSFSPLDIAVLQDLYGANTTNGAGDTVYTLPSLNEAGTFFSSIWDVGGVDTIKAGSDEGTLINLNAATLQYEDGGGGFISYHLSILGGFTIANGVVIENALGGAGDDELIGNAADNQLSGGSGNDSLIGGGGSDRLIGGAGDDELTGGEGGDIYVMDFGAGHDRILDFEVGADRIELGAGVYNMNSLSMVQFGADVVIKTASGIVTLVGVDLAALDASNFIFRLFSEDINGAAAKPTNAQNSPAIDLQINASSHQDTIAVFLSAPIVEQAALHELGVSDWLSLGESHDNSFFEGQFDWFHIV